METNKTAVVDQLNSFLRGEISSVETYQKAMEKLKDSKARPQLTEVMTSHEQRVRALKDRITSLGGKPTDGSGIWGAFAKLYQGGATVAGDSAAIAALESGEDHGLADYRRDLSKLDGDTRTFVESNLLPEQEQTHRVLSTLKKTLH